jgi:peptidoglycan/LPS O-acetylase OafA/YrhL
MPSLQQSKHVYFKGFNFVRFFAASLVVVHHTEYFKYMLGYENLWLNGIVRHLGDRGVTLFFVLSGFLITYLLLIEKEKSGTVRIKYFYVRRILRIWPLYFLVILLAIFILPKFTFFRTNMSSIIENNFLPILVLNLAILPNLSLFLFGAVPFSSQAWSVGVEEQFYLLWPLLIKYVEKIFFVLILIIVLLIILQNSGIVLSKVLGQSRMATFNLSRIVYFFRLMRFDCMAFGSLAGLALFRNHPIVAFCNRSYISIIIVIMTLLIVFNPVRILFFENQIQSIVFSLLILNFASARRNVFRLENRITTLLGSISYGIYMFHPLVCFSVIKLSDGRFSDFAVYSLIFMFTLLLASISYYFFERKLIAIKSKRFTIIQSN